MMQEIFDEVTEEQLAPAWSYDLNSVLAVLAEALQQSHQISALEDHLAEVRVCLCLLFV
jgi:hypothetical protein